MGDKFILKVRQLSLMEAGILIVLLGILAALASAGFFMLKKSGTQDDRRGKKMARALAVRVILSILLFILVWVAYALGWIQPSGVPIER